MTPFVDPMPPADEARRVAALLELGILDTPPEQSFDDLAKLAALICEAPTALVSLVDHKRQWFKARTGTDLTETDLSRSVCNHAIRQSEILVIRDTLDDPRTRTNPLNEEVGMRFYAGMPLIGSDGHAYGTLCVLDTKSRDLSERQAFALETLARQVTTQLELRRAVSSQTVLRQEIDHRVKNSLQQAAVFLRLQKRVSGDAQVTSALDSALGRIGAIATVHDTLAKLAATDSVALRDFMAGFVETLSIATPPDIRITSDVPGIRIPTRHASNIAVFVNEFAANAIKHAFPDGQPGTIAFSMTQVGETWRFAASDDGIGRDATASGGLGSTIMAATADALGAVLTEHEVETGVTVTLDIPRQGFETATSLSILSR